MPLYKVNKDQRFADQSPPSKEARSRAFAGWRDKLRGMLKRMGSDAVFMEGKRLKIHPSNQCTGTKKDCRFCFYTYCEKSKPGYVDEAKVQHGKWG